MIECGEINRKNFRFLNYGIKQSFSSLLIDTTNKFVYLGDDEGHLYVFDLKTGRLLSSIEIHSSKVAQMNFRYDRNLLITFCESEAKIFKIGFMSEEDQDFNCINRYKIGYI